MPTRIGPKLYGHRVPKGATAAVWLGIAERLDAENPGSSTLRKGHHLADSGVPSGPVWGHIVARLQDAQDSGAFTDGEGAQAWLTANLSAVLKEAQARRDAREAEHSVRSAGKRTQLAGRESLLAAGSP